MVIPTSKLSALHIKMLWVFLYSISLIDLVIICWFREIRKLF